MHPSLRPTSFLLTLPALAVGLALGLWWSSSQGKTPVETSVDENAHSVSFMAQTSIKQTTADTTTLPNGPGASWLNPKTPEQAPAMRWEDPPAPTHKSLPPAIAQRLASAGITPNSVSALVQAVGSHAAPLLAVNAQTPRNPASVTKLITTFAALDTLGPAWQWRTPVWLHGQIANDRLYGDLIVKGVGDPQLVIEHLWLGLQEVRSRGITHIEGDIIIDNSAFALPTADPAEFDGESARAYNVQPDAALFNYKALTLSFTPIPAQGKALIQAVPPLDELQVPPSVPLAEGVCGDWRGQLKRELSAQAITFSGSYPASCGTSQWSMALDPENFNARMLAGLWRSMGGKLNGLARNGLAPPTEPQLYWVSPPVTDAIGLINKYSNNVMAQQLYLSLPLALRLQNSYNPANPPRIDAPTAQEFTQQWLERRIGWPKQSFFIDSGSGLSRQTRLSAAHLNHLLQVAWSSPVMPEFISSLPLLGVNGTLRQSSATRYGAHLKTGTLNDANALSGYVRARSGTLYCFTAIVNQNAAAQARPSLEALVDWVIVNG